MLILLFTSKVPLRPCMAAANCSTHTQPRCSRLQQVLTMCSMQATWASGWGHSFTTCSCITPAILATLSAPTPSAHIGCGATVGCDCAQHCGRLLVRLGQLLRLGSCVPNWQPAAAGAAARSLWRILGLPSLLHGVLSARPIHAVLHTETVSCNGHRLSLPQWLAGPLFSGATHLCSELQKGCLLQAVQLRPFTNVCGLASLSL